MNRLTLECMDRKDLEDLCYNLLEVARDFTNLINTSSGVAGLHRNGDEAPWEELLPWGRYEEWLVSLEKVGEYL